MLIISAESHSFGMHLMCHFHLPLIYHTITSHFRFYSFSTCWLTILCMVFFCPLFVWFSAHSFGFGAVYTYTHTRKVILVLILNYLLFGFYSCHREYFIMLSMLCVLLSPVSLLYDWKPSLSLSFCRSCSKSSIELRVWLATKNLVIN